MPKTPCKMSSPEATTPSPLRSLHALYRASFVVSRSLSPLFVGILLGRALDALGTWMHVIVLLIRAIHASCARLLACGIHSLECEVFSHRVLRREGVRNLAGRQNGLESADVLGSHGCAILATQTLGELDIELDVQVAMVMVPV